MSAPVLQTAGVGNIDELLTTTMVNMLPGIRDNVFSSNTVFKYRSKNNKIKSRGGASVSHGVLYGNGVAGAYQRYDMLNTTPVDGLTRDQWEWRQYYANISQDGFTQRANAGQFKVEDWAETKKMQAEEQLSLQLEQDLFAAVPASKSIRSLASIVASTGTEGQIDPTSSTWWAAYSATCGSFAANGRPSLTTAYNALSARNPSTPPNLIVSSQTEFEYYESILVPQERFTDNSMVDIGIQNLKFKQTPWIWSPQASSGSIYLLHDKAFELVVQDNTDFIMTEFVKPANQDAKVAQILVTLALVTGNRRKNGKLTGVTA